MAEIATSSEMIATKIRLEFMSAPWISVTEFACVGGAGDSRLFFLERLGPDSSHAG